jgi:hypothetical protein
MKTDREKLIGVLRLGASQAYSLDTKEDCEELADHLISEGVTIPVRCGECKHNYSNWEHEENDVTDYSDITCDYFMTDGMDREDFCSYGERKEE